MKSCSHRKIKTLNRKDPTVPKIFKLIERTEWFPPVVEGVGEMGRCWSKVKDEVSSGNLMCNLVITASITVVYI